jgi:hypothetical protein
VVQDDEVGLLRGWTLRFQRILELRLGITAGAGCTAGVAEMATPCSIAETELMWGYENALGE